eukprot:30763_5
MMMMMKKMEIMNTKRGKKRRITMMMVKTKVRMKKITIARKKGDLPSEMSYCFSWKKTKSSRCCRKHLRHLTTLHHLLNVLHMSVIYCHNAHHILRSFPQTSQITSKGNNEVIKQTKGTCLLV